MKNNSSTIRFLFSSLVSCNQAQNVFSERKTNTTVIYPLKYCGCLHDAVFFYKLEFFAMYIVDAFVSFEMIPL